jgi:hypothetical protein
MRGQGGAINIYADGSRKVKGHTGMARLSRSDEL